MRLEIGRFIRPNPVNTITTTEWLKILQVKNVMVSGAGGSIWFRTVRQIIKFKTYSISVIRVVSEFALFQIEKKLSENTYIKNGLKVKTFTP